MRARVHDPLGPRWTRRVVPALAVLVMLVGLLTPAGAALRASVALAGVALLVASRLLQVLHASREVVLRLGAGHVDVPRAGLLSQRIRARSVRAASSARTAKGVALALVRSDAPERPIVLELQSEDDLTRVRRALGIGHFGCGEIAWPTTRTDPVSSLGRAVASALLSFGWLAMAIVAAFGRAEMCLAIALPLVPATIAVAIASLAAQRPGARVTLGSHAMTLFDRQGARSSAAYADVVDIRPGEVCLRLQTRAGQLVIPTQEMTPEEREHVGAQIVSAVQRTRGEGPPPPGLPPSLAVLAPREEARSAWLARLDTAAASLAGGGGYRRSDLDTDDLWTALESPDAPAPIRAAAARVLARIAPAEARTRIAQVLESEHDERALAHIRVALEEDVDVAAAELDRLDYAGDHS